MGEVYRAFWQRSQLSHSYRHLQIWLSSGLSLGKVMACSPSLREHAVGETRPIIKESSKYTRQILHSVQQRLRESYCFLSQQKFYYTRFHHKNAVILNVCLLCTQCSYSILHHLSNLSLMGV